MKLKEIFDQLTYGELSQISIGGAKAGEIIEPDYPKVAASVSLGLTALHTRFPLKEGTHILTVVPGTLTYSLSTLTDLIKVERVYGEDGFELPLNVRDNADSVRTPNFKTLVLPATFTGNTVKVIYRANHRPLTEELWSDPESAEIEIPGSHLEALLWYIASRVMNPVGFSGGNGFHEGNNYAAKYEAACALLEQMSVSEGESGGNNWFARGGWV